MSSKKASFTNRCIYLLIIIASITLLLYHRSFSPLSKEDRDCLAEERYMDSNVSESADFGNQYQISFHDQQLNAKWVRIPKVCENSNPSVMMFVQSRPEALSRRMILRETWMNKTNSAMIDFGEMAAVFIIGESKNANVRKMIEAEADLFGDIIIFSSEDNYTRLPYKTLSSFLFALSKCSSVKLIGKIDEDVMFYPDQLNLMIKDGTISLNSSAMYGALYPEGIPVIHRIMRKWYVPPESFKCRYFPAYLSGPIYFVTRKAAYDVLLATKYRNFISIEDVYITGILSGDVGAKVTDLKMLFPEKTMTNDRSTLQLMAWHTNKNDQEYRDAFYYMTITRCTVCRKEHISLPLETTY